MIKIGRKGQKLENRNENKSRSITLRVAGLPRGSPQAYYRFSIRGPARFIKWTIEFAKRKPVAV